MKSKLVLLCIVVIAVFGGWYFYSHRSQSALDTTTANEDDTNPTQAVTSLTILPAPPLPTHPLISVDVDTVNKPLKSPATITGQAKGNWYFEASFPVELKNNSNVIIGTGVAKAQSDWMTTNFVPFTVSVSFPPQPAGSSGTLVFKKDNPSGEPANDDQYVIPVSF